MATFHCAICQQSKQVRTSGGTGYGTTTARMVERGYVTAPELKVCYACIGATDRLDMCRDGAATLYLSVARKDCAEKMACSGEQTKVSNWPGSLVFPINAGAIKVTRHNIARRRYDVWFTGPDGATWHGVTYGDNTQICHCKRTKG